MKLTRLSLYYLATYLPLAGLALLFVPDFATKLLLSNRTYEDTFMRVAGGMWGGQLPPPGSVEPLDGGVRD